ncbi:NUMOD3 domain-containing DNA-binding protein [Patescibacteria group bacterium]|nr:NUMOD3 domain-containing DNA-binding protein [Patescibacteria group bacterium]
MGTKRNIGKDNPMYGRRHSEATREKMRQASLGSKNVMWKGNNVGYISLHLWVRSHKPKPVLCECCQLKPPFDLAAINGEYSRNLDNWEWLCRSCHMKKDGRLDKLPKRQAIKLMIRCRYCNKIFFVTPCYSNQKYCSKTCSNKGRILFDGYKTTNRKANVLQQTNG